MRLNERQEQMVNYILEVGEANIHILTSKFNVSEMTIRRDLIKLEKHGYIYRTFGGAIPAGQDITFKERETHYSEEKKKIGMTAARTIQEGEAIFIDGGTTTMYIARSLPVSKQITVVTNALNIAMELSEKNISTIMTGGSIRTETLSLVGPIVERNLADLVFDRVFLGASGLTLEHGFSNSNVFEADVKRQVMNQTNEVNIVMDKSKIGKKSLNLFADVARVDHLFIDQLPSKDILQGIQEKGTKIIVVD